MGKCSAQLIVAVDVPTFEEAREIIDSLSEVVGIFKIGSQLFTACGPAVVRYIQAKGCDVFLDLKFHDIPNTVANALESVIGLNQTVHDIAEEDGTRKSKKGNVILCTLHTVGGLEMLKSSVQRAIKVSETIGVKKPALLGITVLTSEDKGNNIQSIVIERAKVAQQAGLEGVVASSQEAEILRREFGKDFVIVTPGIRPEGADVGDQKRVTTPKEAVNNGSNYLVVGRPIVKADDPLQAAKDILKEIETAI